jgi:hydroxymethylpyrimidine pyrophosphatase-like HAD family hydrolase
LTARAASPRYRLLALDIDGTLLRSDKTISPRTLAAVEAARGRGVRVVLVTGRRHPAARRIAEQLGKDLDLVLHNGALIVENGEVLRCLPLSRELALRAVAVGRACAADPVLHCGHGGEGRLMIEGIAPSNTLLVYYLDRSHPDVTSVARLDDALAEDPIAVMFGGSIEPMAVLRERLDAELGGQVRIDRTIYPASGVLILDVMRAGVGKAEALAFLQRRWDVSAPETLAIGDNWNDHEMLEAAGLGLVMGNADPAMLRLGLEVLPTNDEDGVAVAIEREILGTRPMA